MKKKMIIVILLLTELTAIGVFFWKQREKTQEIKNLPQTYETQKVEELPDLMPKDWRENVKDLHAVVRDLSEEEREAYRAGTIAEEDLLNKLVGSTESSLTSQEETDEQRYQRTLAELIARSYLMREDYIGQLDTMMLQAKQEYAAKDAAERTQEQLMAWTREYTERADQLEQECDEKMDALVNELRKLLVKNDGDLTLLDQVIYAYAQEKQEKSDLYLEELLKKGLA